jgi:hypothetical protein
MLRGTSRHSSGPARSSGPAIRWSRRAANRSRLGLRGPRAGSADFGHRVHKQRISLLDDRGDRRELVEFGLIHPLDADQIIEDGVDVLGVNRSPIPSRFRNGRRDGPPGRPSPGFPFASAPFMRRRPRGAHRRSIRRPRAATLRIGRHAAPDSPATCVFWRRRENRPGSVPEGDYPHSLITQPQCSAGGRRAFGSAGATVELTLSPRIWLRRDWAGVANKTRNMVDWFACCRPICHR